MIYCTHTVCSLTIRLLAANSINSTLMKVIQGRLQRHDHTLLVVLFVVFSQIKVIKWGSDWLYSFVIMLLFSCNCAHVLSNWSIWFRWENDLLFMAEYRIGTKILSSSDDSWCFFVKLLPICGICYDNWCHLFCLHLLCADISCYAN